MKSLKRIFNSSFFFRTKLLSLEILEKQNLKRDKNQQYPESKMSQLINCDVFFKPSKKQDKPFSMMS